MILFNKLQLVKTLLILLSFYRNIVYSFPRTARHIWLQVVFTALQGLFPLIVNITLPLMLPKLNAVRHNLKPDVARGIKWVLNFRSCGPRIELHRRRHPQRDDPLVRGDVGHEELRLLARRHTTLPRPSHHGSGFNHNNCWRCQGGKWGHKRCQRCMMLLQFSLNNSIIMIWI